MLRLGSHVVQCKRLRSQRIFMTSKSSNSVGSAESISRSATIIAGSCAGILSALTGLGGGTILIPVLAKWTTLSQQIVNGTSIGAITVSTAVGSWNYFRQGACNYPIAFVTTLPAILCSRYGVRVAHNLSSKRLSLVGGVIMIAASPLILLKQSGHLPKFSKITHPLDLQLFPSEPGSIKSFWANASDDLLGFLGINCKYLVAGAVAGFISGLCGTGGGILMTSYLTVVSDMPQEAIIGTSLLGIVPSASAATWYNIKAKTIHVPTSIRLGASLVVSMYLTSEYVTLQLSEDFLRGFLGVTLGAAAMVMFKRSL
uniref:Uncharacterized protein AlNc14C71G4888 n=1 Tax=Albugo laibachii Nc14 TaxID=890382 RepID=F0WE27_9STRA|nr:conserved hypothetical protein [Albugo laibachii Nc14]|eukprot:CCA19456.1 conserved hypothetical protein [Albugo laibachii Nc14]